MLLAHYLNSVQLFVCVSADRSKRRAAANRVDTGLSSGGRAETTPSTAAPQSKVKVEPPLVEEILRYPIEVFVSTGEGFVHPESTSAEPVIRCCRLCINGLSGSPLTYFGKKTFSGHCHVHGIDELRQRLLHVWRGFEQSQIGDAVDYSATRLRACVPMMDILNIPCDCQFIFSVLDELYVSHQA